MTTRTYFLPPDFLSYSAGNAVTPGRIRLGQLIHSIDDPAYTVRTLPPVDLAQYKDIPMRELEFSCMDHSDAESSAKLYSLFIKAVGIVGAKLGFQTTHSSKLLSVMNRLESQTIDPTDKYVGASVAQADVQSWLNSRWFGKRIFMVTSILIAHPSESSKIDQSTTSSTDIEGSAEGDATAPTGGNAPVKGGANLNSTITKEFGLSFVPKDPFVYAFQVRECFYKKTVGSSKAYHKGAQLHAGIASEQGDGGREAAEFEVSGLAQEETSFDDLGDLDENFVSHGAVGEEVVLVAPKLA